MAESVQNYEHIEALERRLRTRGDGWTWILAIVAMLLPLWAHASYLDGDAILYHGDAAQLQFPRYVTLCESLQRGEFPLWQTLVYGGSPFHANPENPTLYPPTLLFAALTTPAWTINLTILAHLALAALGAFLLTRRLAQRAELPPSVVPAGALVAATFFAFAHFTRRDHINLVAYGAAHALIPWTILLADGLLHGERPRRAAGLLALAMALLFFTGGLYVIPYAFVALGLWMLVEGLLGDPRARRRTLTFGVLAAAAAGLMIAAKLLPYRDWVPTTNRAGPLSVEDALSTSLGGKGSFEWDGVGKRVHSFLGGFAVFVPGLLAFALVRRRAVRLVLGLTLLGFAVGLGGGAWRFFYEFVPPFDQIRSAVRAWTLVNAFYPIAAGLGACWLFARVPRLRERAGLGALAGVAAALVSIPLLTGNDPREERLERPMQPFAACTQAAGWCLWHPDSLDEVATRYPRWREASERAGENWRVADLERSQPDGRNEQFATSLFGAETVAGYQGHVWPGRLGQHLYGPEGARIDRATRERRLATLSARWLVALDEGVEPLRDPGETSPRGIEGTVLLENVDARPRFSMPGVVVAWVNDEAGLGARSILDHPQFPLRDAAVVSLPLAHSSDGERATDAEWAAVDVVVVSAPVNVSGDLLGPLRSKLAAGAEIVEIPVHLDAAQRMEAIERVALLARERANAARTVELGFDREGEGRALLHVIGVDVAEGRTGRFAVVTEPWAWYPGWELEGLEAAPALRLADGIGTAFLLPATPPTSPLVAVYRPGSTLPGLIVGALGLLMALGMVFVPGGRG